MPLLRLEYSQITNTELFQAHKDNSAWTIDKQFYILFISLDLSDKVTCAFTVSNASVL